jgi:hypothetical protein
MGQTERPFAIEYYYKTRWGFAEEFIRLFRKNHYPVLKKQMEMGRILEIKAVRPKFHATEEGRWDYRITLVWKNAALINDGFSDSDIKKQLYPDQETFNKEELHRFEILDAHWDLPVVDVEL